MLLEIDQVWTSTGSSGGALALTAVEIHGPIRDSVLYCNASTLASTQSFSFQTAAASTGPWVTENSTALGATANATAAAAIRVSGPYGWMRPQLNSASTGNYTFRLMGV